MLITTVTDTDAPTGEPLSGPVGGSKFADCTWLVCKDALCKLHLFRNIAAGRHVRVQSTGRSLLPLFCLSVLSAALSTVQCLYLRTHINVRVGQQNCCHYLKLKMLTDTRQKWQRERGVPKSCSPLVFLLLLEQTEKAEKPTICFSWLSSLQQPNVWFSVSSELGYDSDYRQTAAGNWASNCLQFNCRR